MGNGSKPVRVAVMGVRHGHIYGVINQLKTREDAVLVAGCEEDAETRAAMVAAGVTETPFDDYTRMLDTVECDAVAVGDYYTKRGAVIIEALRRGKHVISDKPICTALEELDEIETLSREKGLSVGCQLDMRYNAAFRTLRRVVRNGEIGEVHAISFDGQHPLMYGRRAGWYFEEGKHGGTLNDIAIHACDYIPWITGRRFAMVNAARNWNTRPQVWPHFRDAAQVMFTLENGGGVLGDVSYLTPDSFTYKLPQYHRTTVWGTDGMAEAGINLPAVMCYRNGDAEPQAIEFDPVPDGGTLNDFLRELRGETEGLELTTAEVLDAARVVLTAQHAADTGLTNVAIPA